MDIRQRVKPVFAWPGGKSWALKFILPSITPHICYCEVFGGGLAVLMAKERSKIEVVNDINSDLVRFFRCVKFHLDELIREIQWVLNSREEFCDYGEQPGLTDLQMAARWFIRQRLSFGGTGKSFAVGKTSGGGAYKSRQNICSHFEEVNQRLDKVAIENLDWKRCLKNYDGPRTFFFMDPPYSEGKIDNYHEWYEDNLEEFALLVRQLKGDWLVTLNDNDFNRKLFKGHCIKALARPRGIENKSGKAKIYKEILISKRG